MISNTDLVLSNLLIRLKVFPSCSKIAQCDQSNCPAPSAPGALGFSNPAKQNISNLTYLKHFSLKIWVSLLPNCFEKYDPLSEVWQVVQVKESRDNFPIGHQFPGLLPGRQITKWTKDCSNVNSRKLEIVLVTSVAVGFVVFHAFSYIFLVSFVFSWFWCYYPHTSRGLVVSRMRHYF